MTHPHLEAIDAAAWPGVAAVPEGRLTEFRARRAEAAFARACEKAGLVLDPDADPDLIVDHEELFSRLATSGWLGLAEGYLAAEWRTDRLVKVLTALLEVDFQPKRTRAEVPAGRYTGGELPAELVSLSSGDGMSSFGGVFATGVPTTVRTAVPSHVPGAGRGAEPATHFVDLTTYSAPTAVERADLGDAQARTVDMLLDAAQVTAGTHLLEYPSVGGALAIRAAHRRATVDTLTADPAQAQAVRERLTLAGVTDSVHTEVIERPVPGSRDWRGRYDAIVSVEKLEVLSRPDRPRFIQSLDRLLAIGGRVSLQSVVATDTLSDAAKAALGVLRAYIWPGLEFPRSDDIHRLADRDSGLRVIAQTHLGVHYAQTLRIQQSVFEGQSREAAADGFDAVYRRLWTYQYALREALFNLGMLDAVQFTLTHRNRRGRR
ncbi:class I SAM-dependent methyltransferase [Corynebacterium halotolerans]|uniref:Cyclopropane-fatty-acyl-phospholipid synthase n=1 Tax=Corynebacterium halotolerans YIM 70093 = DSM 44683 TaxID=1121362 RepID=M1P726_9CORY|nr:class I SAM-dependent methyltransferase [Corynebacterium halotolerans]AGF72441.1 cyclopropane-fatty-acyl-phospholipid synthase [Corynebacterium halotolerans YIM 70093 = DSM 44683]